MTYKLRTEHTSLSNDSVFTLSSPLKLTFFLYDGFPTTYLFLVGTNCILLRILSIKLSLWYQEATVDDEGDYEQQETDDEEPAEE